MDIVKDKPIYAEYDYKYLFSKVKTCIEAAEIMYKNEHGSESGGAAVKKEIAIQMVLGNLNIAPRDQQYYHEMVSDIIEGIFDIKKNGLNVNSSKQRSMCWNSCFFCFQLTKPKPKSTSTPEQV